MGSTKHIRNNGEHLNIHGHDNYQMPGAYKQMGDKNQNQSLGAGKELKGDQKDKLPIELQEAIIKSDQPGKISGGAAAYIRGAYGADKIGDPKTDPKEIKLKDPKVPSGSVTSYTKDNIKDVIKSQNEFDANTISASQNLAEIDSLKLVASGKSNEAQKLYGQQYTSDKKLTTNFDAGTYDPYNRGHINPNGKMRSENIKKLKNEARKIQGPRPTLGANKKYKH